MKLILLIENYKMESLVTSQLVLSNKTSKIISPILSSQIQTGDYGKFMPSSQVNSMFLNKCSEDEAATESSNTFTPETPTLSDECHLGT